MSHFDYRLIMRLEYLFAALALAWAFWRGDRSARLVAAIYAGAILAAAPEHLHLAGKWIYRLIDPAVFAATLAVTLRRPRPWLIWSCAFHLATVVAHVARALDPRIGTLAFVTAVNSWWLLALACLCWGTVEAERARRRAQAA